MKLLSEIKDLNGKKVLLRTDLDVPMADGKIVESFRIERQKKTIDHLLEGGAKVFMVAHINAISSFEPILEQITAILGHPVKFIPDHKNKFTGNETNSLCLLENVKTNPGEKENDKEFSKDLAGGFDYYVNNGFAESHRNYASISGVAGLLPSYAGFLLEEETEQLTRSINEPAEGKVIIISGAKASTKVPVIKNFIGKAEKILLGGVVVNDIYFQKGKDIDGSMFDKNSAELLAGLDIDDPRLILPNDFSKEEGVISDIGPESIENFKNIVSGAKMIIWNGPLGKYENDKFAVGTNEVAKAVANSGAYKVLGGGDTVTAVNKLGLLDKFDFVSTGGGSMLAFLAGDKLPGLDVLGYYKEE